MRTCSGSIMKTKAILFVAVLSAVLFEGCSGDDSTKAAPEAASPETAVPASVTRKEITDAAIAASGSDAATADAWLWAASLVDLSFDGKPEPMVVPSYRGGDGRWVCPARDAECAEYPAGLPETLDVANARREAADALRATFASKSQKGRSKIYAAQTLIEVHREIANIDMAEERSFPHDPSYLRTQLEIIKSTPIIEQVVREGNLLEELGMASGGKAPGTARSTFDRTVRFVKSHTHLSILPDTDLIAIQVRLDRPEKPEGMAVKVAARIANLFAEVYKNHVREQSRLRVQSGIVQLEANLEDVDRQIGEQEERYRQLRERYGVTVVSQGDSGADVLRPQVLELTGKGEQARADARVKRSRFERFAALSLEDALAAAPLLVNDQSLVNLLAKRQELETAMAAHTEAGLDPNHPDVVRARADLEHVNRRIEENLFRIRTGLRIAWEQAEDEADMYEEQLAVKTTSERSVSGGVALEMERMKQDLEVLKALRAQIQMRSMTERLNLEMPKTSVRVIEPATVPEVPVPARLDVTDTVLVAEFHLAGGGRLLLVRDESGKWVPVSERDIRSFFGKIVD